MFDLLFNQHSSLRLGANPGYLCSW